MILGIDPGLRHCGWALVEPVNRVIAWGEWNSDPSAATPERVASIVNEASRMMDGCDTIAVEGWDARAGVRGAAMSSTPRIIGELVATARERRVACVELPTQLAKELCGLERKCEKATVRARVVRVCAGNVPPNMAKHQHAFDAIVVALGAMKCL